MAPTFTSPATVTVTDAATGEVYFVGTIPF
jgi:hypothetical protein